MSGSALDTPMMRQFLAIKAEHPDSILFYRMGDFYEMFMGDAELAAPLLDIALTTRDKGKADAVPMCGVPVHAADQHIRHLASLGHRVAICEQVEDPRQVGGRRLVKRQVVEVVTPGLVGDPTGLEGDREITVVAIDPSGPGVGLAALDASTGDFRATEWGALATGEATDEADGAALPERVWQELERIAPREILLPGDRVEAWRQALSERLPASVVTAIDAGHYDPARAPVRPDGFAADPSSAASRASAAILRYLGSNQPFALGAAPRLRAYSLGEAMVIDAATRTHLELFENGEDRGREGTLFERLDETCTPLGARRLARWLAYPLIDPTPIGARLDAVEWLAERDRQRGRIRDALRPVRDLERLLAKAVRPGAMPRDLGALRGSLEALPQVVAALDPEAGDATDSTPLWPEGRPADLPRPRAVPELAQLLRDALVDEPPVVARGSRGANETGYIREGHRPELDGLRESAAKGRDWIAGLEASERERTGISGLKVRFHPVHGYSFEVSKAQLARVPEHYERKQTLASVERFTTEELREVEGRVMGAHERAAALEREIFEGLREQVVESAGEVRAAAVEIANLDALTSMAEVARLEGWVRPEVDDAERLQIVGGRHPVVESMLRRRGSDGFVPNDTTLDPSSDAQIWLLTGPNMSGKSTYLRQVALIALMAQMGSFVPAESARIGVVDRVFTRVGASDRLARGESTFMVEMRETAEILAQASPRSLVILDEIGRGTSTFDGLAIAWAVAEYLHDTPGLRARTLFATHYHELTDLALTKDRVRNGHFEAREWNEEVVFLRRLVDGGASRSYGIQVAKLAGLPDALIARARSILANLEEGELDPQGRPRLARAEKPSAAPAEGQLPLFATGASAAEREVLDELLEIDPERTTPLSALETLMRWRERIERGGGS